MKALSETFFAGNSEAALEHALSLGYDSKEIAQFSLELNQDIERRVTTAYSEVSQYAVATQQVPGGMQKLLEPVRSFMLDMLDSIRQAEQTGLFEDAAKTTADLMAKVSRMNDNYAERIDALEKRANAQLETVTQQLADVLRPLLHKEQ